jgi:hypothetical protein
VEDLVEVGKLEEHRRLKEIALSKSIVVVARLKKSLYVTQTQELKPEIGKY